MAGAVPPALLPTITARHRPATGPGGPDCRRCGHQIRREVLRWTRSSARRYAYG